MSRPAMAGLSFTTRRVNATTFVICEDDAYGERPLIFAKLHSTAPVLILSDTGCDSPRGGRDPKEYIDLRTYLERVPLAVNNGESLNPGGRRRYIIICTHCHFDHIGGITQFLPGGTTEVVSSATGRDFVENDLDEHSLFKYIGRPVPYFQVTKWARAFERLSWPFQHEWDVNKSNAGAARELKSSNPVDLGITIVHTPGHTPDELAWYDSAEMHLYVGDSFYEQGSSGIAISWPKHGDLVEWSFSMQKLLALVRGENDRAAASAEANDHNNSSDDWVTVSRRVLVSCGHETTSVDAEDLLLRVERFWQRALHGEVPVVRSVFERGETYDVWRDANLSPSDVFFAAPRRLMDEARLFFGLHL